MEALRVMLKEAIRVELSTIPLYLYSIYSIVKDNGGGGTKARARIQVVVHQEMLHLALAGNLMTSIDTAPRLYSPEFIPQYGGEGDVILATQIPLKLQRCNKSNLQNFVLIEAPYVPQPGVPPIVGNQLENYRSIGNFYKDLEQKIKALNDISFGNENFQFSSNEFFPGQMVQVNDLESAMKALNIIIDQGEGSVGVEDAHYQMFLDLYLQQTNWGWHEVPDSPHAVNYVGNVLVYQLALASNAAYCYLLITIQKTWEVNNLPRRRALIDNIHSIMVNIITPLAEFMVVEPFGDGTAAPTFEYYDVGIANVDEAAVALWTAIQTRLQNAINALGVGDVVKKQALNVIGFSVERILWPA